MKININNVVIAKGARRIVESGRWELSRIFSWVLRIIQLDQSEYVPGGVLLKDEFSCCIQWSYTLATTSNTQDDKTLNVSAEEFQTKR